MNRVLQFKNKKHPCVWCIRALSLFLGLSLMGCAHIISTETLNEVDRTISFKELSKDPGKYKERIVLLGGVIVKTENRNDGTLLEIYQTEIDSYGKPVNTDSSEGRFLAMDKRFLDSEIYKAGRKVTVVGIVSGVEIKKLGETDYSYPYLMIREIHLWKEKPPERYGPRYRYYWDPYWGHPWHRWHYPYLYYPYTLYY